MSMTTREKDDDINTRMFGKLQLSNSILKVYIDWKRNRFFDTR